MRHHYHHYYYFSTPESFEQLSVALFVAHLFWQEVELHIQVGGGNIVQYQYILILFCYEVSIESSLVLVFILYFVYALQVVSFRWVLTFNTTCCGCCSFCMILLLCVLERCCILVCAIHKSSESCISITASYLHGSAFLSASQQFLQRPNYKPQLHSSPAHCH